MSTKEISVGAAGGSVEELSAAESCLGKVLALIHRSLGRMDDPERGAEVQSSLRKALALLENARQAHAQLMDSGGLSVNTDTPVEPEIVAVIAAAISVALETPYRMVAVQQVIIPVPHLNVWALEGRTQIFSSHKVR